MTLAHSLLYYILNSNLLFWCLSFCSVLSWIENNIPVEWGSKSWGWCLSPNLMGISDRYQLLSHMQNPCNALVSELKKSDRGSCVPNLLHSHCPTWLLITHHIQRHIWCLCSSPREWNAQNTGTNHNCFAIWFTTSEGSVIGWRRTFSAVHVGLFANQRKGTNGDHLQRDVLIDKAINVIGQTDKHGQSTLLLNPISPGSHSMCHG